MRRRDFLQSSFGALAAAALVGPAANAMIPRTGQSRRILYMLGQFAASTPEQMRTVVETLGPSSFNVLILSFLQASVAQGKLALSYNGNGFPSLSPEVPGLLSRLRSGFGARKRVLLSIGGWQQEPTFTAIRSFGVPAFVRQLTREAIQPLGLDGIDLDLEPQTGGLDQWMAVHREHGKTIVDLTNEYKRVHPTHVVTHAPISAVAAQMYAEPAPIPGLNGGLLHATRTRDGNNVDWLNVQLYEGGIVPGGDIAGFYRDSLVIPLTRMAGQSGITGPLLSFLVPLFEPEAKQSLAFCKRSLISIDNRCADLHAGRLSGVALWDYRQVAPSVRDWSQGLEAALQ